MAEYDSLVYIPRVIVGHMDNVKKVKVVAMASRVLRLRARMPGLPRATPSIYLQHGGEH